MENEPAKQSEKKDIASLIASDAAKRQFAMALPRHLTPERFTRIALTAINKTPGLLNCTRESLWACVLDLAQLGLEPDGRKAHIIPYGKVATLLIDYKGLVELARRSGEIADIHADVVCGNDEFNYSFGSDAKLVHKPNLIDRGKVIAAYSFVRLKDGATSYEVMNIDEIEAIRGRSKAGKSGPWVTDWNEMAKKTVFRRHSKWLPLSSEFQEAIDKDIDVPSDLVSGGKPLIEMPKPKVIEVTPEPEKKEQEFASKAQMKAFYKIAPKAGLVTDADILDFMATVGVTDPDNVTIEQYQTLLNAAMKKIDEKDAKTAKV